MSAQSLKIKTPSYSLTSINTSIIIEGIPDSVKDVSVLVSGNNFSSQELYKVTNNKIDTSITFTDGGNYSINVEGLNKSATIRVIPGWLSILPPLLAIILALVIRQVLTSLSVGILLGAIIIYDYNPLVALLRVSDTIIIDTLNDHDHIVIIVFTLLFGGVIGVISRNGGTIGLSNIFTKFAKSSRSGMLSTWFMGIMIFFDDYANSLIIGNMMRPITDKLKVSREKLAYIVDSTAAPVASIFIISSWIGFEVGLIDAGLKAAGVSENAYEVLISTIPYRFYPIAALFFVFATSFTRRDFGAMYKAEMRARTTGELYSPGSVVDDLKDTDGYIYKGEKSKWFNAAVPIAVILFGTIAGLVFTGYSSLVEKGVTDFGFKEIISNSDSFAAIIWASFFACIVAILMTATQKILSLNDTLNAWMKGLQSMLFACVILVLAWAISSVTNQLHTADYLISILSDAIDPRFLPVLVFILCGLISFATGTSWGTMAIVMPIVIPLTFKLTASFGYNYSDTLLILYGVESSVLAGSVFGDHCSPIADTTILSSMASGSNHIDHVKTQLPYALFVGIVCMLIGDLATSFGLNVFLANGIIFTALLVGLLLIGKKVPDMVVGK